MNMKLIDEDALIKQLEHIKTDNSCSDCKYKDKCNELQDFYNPSDDVDLCGLTIKYIAIEIVKANMIMEDYNRIMERKTKSKALFLVSKLNEDNITYEQALKIIDILTEEMELE